MEEILRPVKKPSGCLKASGCLLTVGSVLFILLCILLTFDAEEKMDENRAEYAASTKEYEDALMAYEADSAHLHAEYQRIQGLIKQAEAKGDSLLVANLTDSLALYDEPVWEPRGHIGFNIAGAFYLFFALCALIPLLIGLILLILHRRRKRKYQQYQRDLLSGT